MTQETTVAASTTAATEAPTMNRTQVKPGTPLPWTFEPHDEGSDWLGNIVGHYGFNANGIKEIRTISCLTKYGSIAERTANALYAVHAANAYPRLVEALKSVWENYYNMDGDEQSVARAARQLLADLGETP